MTRPWPFPVADRLGRPLGSLRLSVTDRCNMRCRYCMPEERYAWLPRSSILSFEELSRITEVFTGLGVGKVRLTGGEPLLRQGLPELVRLLSSNPAVADLALTTNGLLLARHADSLREAGLGRVTVSLDTLVPERLRQFARTDRHADILRGIDAVRAAGFPMKLNTVLIRGFNDDEILPLLEYAGSLGAELRFIEYMDVGGATEWSSGSVISREEILATLARRHGIPEPLPEPDNPSAPADRYRLPDGTVFGIIASTTAPFCRDCDRMRITADGTCYLCLYADQGIDLRGPLRSGASEAELAALIVGAWRARTDRGAEERRETPDRVALYQLDSLRADPRREMHTRGG